jgi:hypothetical protein
MAIWSFAMSKTTARPKRLKPRLVAALWWRGACPPGHLPVPVSQGFGHAMRAFFRALDGFEFLEVEPTLPPERPRLFQAGEGSVSDRARHQRRLKAGCLSRQSRMQPGYRLPARPGCVKAAMMTRALVDRHDDRITSVLSCHTWRPQPASTKPAGEVSTWMHPTPGLRLVFHLSTQDAVSKPCQKGRVRSTLMNRTSMRSTHTVGARRATGSTRGEVHNAGCRGLGCLQSGKLGLNMKKQGARGSRISVQSDQLFAARSPGFPASEPALPAIECADPHCRSASTRAVRMRQRPARRTPRLLYPTKPAIGGVSGPAQAGCPAWMHPTCQIHLPFPIFTL